jgi:hypothetical protein
MAWFKYLKSTENVNSFTANTAYSYPYCKRFIGRFTPRDTINSGTWIFANVSDVNINIYKDTSLENQTDETSYIVIYEKGDNVYPVETVIEGDYIYFKTYELHTAAEEITGEYAVYYNTPNLRKINTVNNGGTTGYRVDSVSNPFYANYSSVNTGQYLVNLDSDSSYNFSFINPMTDWDNGLSSKSTSKLYMNFTGPKFTLYGAKGPNYGKFRIKFTALSDNINTINSLALDWQVIDCFSRTFQDNQILFNKTDFEERDYFVELETLYDKNVLSNGNNIKITSYSFSYNLYLKIKNELVNQSNNSFTVIGGIR